MPHPTKKKVIVAVSGGFDPVHLGHIRLFREARRLGDKLVVIINGDEWTVRKKGRYFMPATERSEIIREFKCVDSVYIHNSDSADVNGALEHLKPNIFANGGDRRKQADILEAQTCKRLGIKMVFNVGGKKIRSSSELLTKYNKL